MHVSVPLHANMWGCAGSKFFMMMLVLQKWVEIIGQARQSVDFLKDQDVIRTVLNILQVFIIFI